MREGTAVATVSEAPLNSMRSGSISLESQSTNVTGASNSASSITQSCPEALKLKVFVDAAEQNRHRLLWLATRITGSSEDAEDIVQQALLNAFRKLSGFRGESQMKTWLSAIVHNTAREYLRDRRRRAVVPLESSAFCEGDSEGFDIADQSMTPEEYYEHHERDRIVDVAIGGLAPANRQVVEMCVFAELPYIEVATILNLSLSTVKSRMFRSRRDLRTAISACTRTMS